MLLLIIITLCTPLHERNPATYYNRIMVAYGLCISGRQNMYCNEVLRHNVKQETIGAIFLTTDARPTSLCRDKTIIIMSSWYNKPCGLTFENWILAKSLLVIEMFTVKWRWDFFSAIKLQCLITKKTAYWLTAWQKLSPRYLDEISSFHKKLVVSCNKALDSKIFFIGQGPAYLNKNTSRPSILFYVQFRKRLHL